MGTEQRERETWRYKYHMYFFTFFLLFSFLFLEFPPFLIADYGRPEKILPVRNVLFELSWE